MTRRPLSLSRRSGTHWDHCLRIRRPYACGVATARLVPLADPDEYLREHVANELHWLLRASNEWVVQDQLRFGISGYHVQVYAMDSAFLHARTLFEFLTQRTGRNHYGVDELGISPIESKVYASEWSDALHEYVMHAKGRSAQRELHALDGTVKDLKTMPPDFAQEVERLWVLFANRLREDGQSARADAVEEILRDARQQAEAVLTNVMAVRREPR